MSPASAVRDARQFRALSDDTRLQILQLLRGGERCVCELTEVLELGQSLLSFHLKTLKDAGLVRDRRQGRWMYYALETNAVEELAASLSQLASSPPRKARPPGRCSDGRPR
jgi:ArsR family transcriptional regulator